MNGRKLAVWIAIGIGAGAAIGAAFDNMGVWVATIWVSGLPLGVAAGAGIGAAMSVKKSRSDVTRRLTFEHVRIWLCSINALQEFAPRARVHVLLSKMPHATTDGRARATIEDS